ncbi:kinase-like domain-containing protein [Lentinula edodes]|nr:kinase-like domain-containing protein [Lentinula edodes]
MDQDVALKRIRVFQGDITGKRKAQRHFCREALLWQKLRHPFVLPFCGIDSESFPSYLCMVSPWMRHGTILNHLHEYGHVNVEQKLFEVAQGLAYLHSQRIVHGDLRGSNILVNDDWHACLADFGLAVFEDATAATPSQQAGSVRWMAPELHHPQAFGLDHFRRTFASDVYSFACVCIELFTGKPPFAHIPHDPAVMLRVMAEERPERSTDPFGRIMPDRLWDITQVCWSHNPLDRSSMTQVVELMMNANTDFQMEIIPVITRSFLSKLLPNFQ